MQRYFFLLLSSLFIPGFSFAQTFEERDFIKYTTKDGLNDNYITCLQQDEQGFLWIGTEAGLNSYDGNTFSRFPSAADDKQLLSNNISQIKKFPSGQLGILTSNGLYSLNSKKFTLKSYFIADTTTFSIYLNHVWDAQQLKDGSIAMTTSTGFYTFDKNGKLIFRYDEYKPSDIGKIIRYGKNLIPISDEELIVYFHIYGTSLFNSKKKHYRVIQPSEKEWSFFSLPPEPVANHWVTKYQRNEHEFIFIHAAIDSIAYYNHQTKKITHSPLPFRCKAELNQDSKITAINNSDFVLNGGNQGFWLLHLDTVTGKITCDRKKYLSSYKINCLFIDKEQRLWAGTSQGLLQQKLNPPFLKVYSLTPDMLRDSSPANLSCAYRYKNKLYVGSFSRNTGLIILDTLTMNPLKTISFFGTNTPWNEVTSIEMYHPDTLWIGTNTGLIWLDTKTDRYGRIIDDKRYPEDVSHLSTVTPQCKDGYAWLSGLLRGKAARYHPASRTFRFFTEQTTPPIPFSTIKQIVVDAFGNAWFSGHSLARWNDQKQTFDTMMIAYAGAKKFNDNILTISADQWGSLWLHNVENGLLQYNIIEKKFSSFSMQNGLPSDNIKSLSPVIGKTLWIAHGTELVNFDIDTKKIIYYDHRDGLPLHKPTSFYIHHDSLTGYCYLFYRNELVKFSSQPPVVTSGSNDLTVQKIVVNNTKTLYDVNGEIRLRPVENDLTVHYTLIDFESGNDYNFAYNLNRSETWTHVGSQRVIRFTDLPSGSYKLQLKAISKSGQEKIKEFNFFISPPFWKTSWFILSMILLLSIIGYTFYRYRVKQINSKANIDRLLAKTEMRALHAQMNPHFIFNSLNSIMEMVLNDDKTNASRYLSNYAQLIRLNLDHSKRSFITLRENIDYLRLYLNLERIRTNSFEYKLNIAEDIDPDEIVLPPMLIQPFIENAIWYGPSNQDTPMQLEVSFLKDKGQLLCIINDNGIGIDASQKIKSARISPHTPAGISNVRQRIQILNEKYKLNCSLVIENKIKPYPLQETGTKVILRLPLNLHDL